LRKVDFSYPQAGKEKSPRVPKKRAGGRGGGGKGVALLVTSLFFERGIVGEWIREREEAAKSINPGRHWYAAGRTGIPADLR